jgi:hypothetical protein
MITVSYQFIEIIALISIIINIVTGMLLVNSQNYVNSLYDLMEEVMGTLVDDDNNELR